MIDYPKARKMKHGLTIKGKARHYLFNAWDSIKQRCYNENNPWYKNYGARGIVIHEPWVKNFILFKDYIIDNLGPRPENFSIDRIDNDKGYNPGNLRWASRKEQQRNNRRCYSVVRIDKDGSTRQYKFLTDVEMDGFNATCVSKCANGLRKSHKGFTWSKH